MITEELGKIEATAFGARKTKSKLSSKTQLFSHGNFLLYRAKKDSPYTIKDAVISDYNDRIRTEIERYFVANCVAEELTGFVEKEMVDENMYIMARDSFRLINGINLNKLVYLLSMIEIKFLSILGYSFDLSTCVQCGKKLDGEVYVDQYRGFPLCEKCRTDNSHHLKEGAVRFILWAQNSELRDSARVVMAYETYIEMRKFIRDIFIYLFHRVPKSWESIPEYREG